MELRQQEQSDEIGTYWHKMAQGLGLEYAFLPAEQPEDSDRRNRRNRNAPNATAEAIFENGHLQLLHLIIVGLYVSSSLFSSSETIIRTKLSPSNSRF